MHEVDLECAPDQGPPRASPHWVRYAACCLWEGYIIGPGIIQRVGGGGVPQVTLVQLMLGLPMGVQGPRRQVYVSLRAVEPLAELFPVGVSLPRHPEIDPQLYSKADRTCSSYWPH